MIMVDKRNRRAAALGDHAAGSEPVELRGRRQSVGREKYARLEGPLAAVAIG